MQIETYFQQSQDTIDGSPVVQSHSVTYEKRGTHEGFIRGEITLVDESVLHVLDCLLALKDEDSPDSRTGSSRQAERL